VIVIINRSTKYGKEYGKGLQTYEVNKNLTRICIFNHIFENGLESCLRAAADEVGRIERRRKGEGNESR